MRRTSLFMVVIALMLFTQHTLAATYVYVSLAGEKTIAIYRQNEETGELTRTGEVQTSGAPGPLTTDPRQQYLFASLRSTGELASFQLNPETGEMKATRQIFFLMIRPH
ncbi:MAG: beta-propeller fold lactonase family protein, partial [Planctomycetales bacterium]|nr:beta-propeller fold lactonase family protein [Planctomycetales bacterium]